MIGPRGRIREDAPDGELVRACAAGDERAWELLVHRFERLVFSIPRRAGLDQERAADVFQEVFATLLRHIERLEDPERVSAWLVTTAKRESWRVLRGVGRERGNPSMDAEDAPELESEGLSMFAMVEQIEEAALVRRLVGMLDDRCAYLITALFLAEVPPSYVEIAAKLDTSEGSVGPTRARCLKKLRALLLEAGL